MIGGVLLADRLMWLQYVSDNGDAINQVEVAETMSIRAPLRRMSRTFVVYDREDGQGAAVISEEKDAAVEVAVPPQVNDAPDSVGDEENTGSFANALVSLGNSLLLGAFCVSYPVAVLPYYRAESTTE